MKKQEKEIIKKVITALRDHDLQMIRPSIYFNWEQEVEGDWHLMFNAFDSEYGNTYIIHINKGNPFNFSSKQTLSPVSIHESVDISDWFEEVYKI